MIGYVYRSHNKITNKYYIGCKLSDTFIPQYFGSGRYLKEAVKRYGKENFEVEIIEWVRDFDDIRILHKRETYWIEYYNAALNSNYYNISATGNSGNSILGLKEQDKIKFIEKQRDNGKKRANGGKGMFGRNISLEGKNNPMYGKKQTERSKALNRQKHLGKKASDETKLKMSKSHCPDNKPPSHKGKKQINKDGVRKSINPEEIDYYLAMGWKLGGLRNKNGKRS